MIFPAVSFTALYFPLYLIDVQQFPWGLPSIWARMSRGHTIGRALRARYAADPGHTASIHKPVHPRLVSSFDLAITYTVDYMDVCRRSASLFRVRYEIVTWICYHSLSRSIHKERSGNSTSRYGCRRMAKAAIPITYEYVGRGLGGIRSSSGQSPMTQGLDLICGPNSNTLKHGVALLVPSYHDHRSSQSHHPPTALRLRAV
ncbi:hypothetical protein BJ322DRAFT_575136 [Thelephora terrestris]|uniref:Uncharacterized protein n=1 Tax=Thelephora terrestris TaxID=56493 RepID=A0A9P6H203_9AGAM|nr:hypothetical protein BJ322DRAFT_575136 [Thelephora terrestris]